VDADLIHQPNPFLLKSPDTIGAFFLPSND
jgi:hypothetical protein